MNVGGISAKVDVDKSFDLEPIFMIILGFVIFFSVTMTISYIIYRLCNKTNNKKDKLKDDKMYCKKCGTEIDNDSSFCFKCGSSVINENNQFKEKEQNKIQMQEKTSTKKIKPILIVVLISILFFIILTVIVNKTSKGNETNQQNNGSLTIKENTTPQLLVKFHANDFQEYYNSPAIFNISPEGKTLIKLVESGSINFIWDLSKYHLSNDYTYILEFENLTFSGTNSENNPNLILQLRWLDTERISFLYYNTNKKEFRYSKENINLYLEQKNYEKYSVEMDLKYIDLKSTTCKQFHIDFKNLEDEGTISFDSLNLYRIPRKQK